MADPKKVNNTEEELMDVQPIIKRSKIRNEYLEKHKDYHNNILQK